MLVYNRNMLKRRAEETITNINKTFKVLMVTGPRQVGKTTLLKSLMPLDMEYVSLDDPVLRRQAEEDPNLFLEEHPAPLLIDEVQYAPSLFPYIKLRVDKSDATGQYWLTGSQQFHLMRRVSESLAGRVGIANMSSLTYSEINEMSNTNIFNPVDVVKPKFNITSTELFKVIFRGGMPQLYDDKELSREIYLQSYIDTYVERDIRDLREVGNSEAFKTFLIGVAEHTGEQLNYSNLASLAGITVPTAKSWMSILVASGLVFLLQPYASSMLKRAVRMPKIIFMDTGLATYLAGWGGAKELQMSPAAGHYFESFVISEAVKAYMAAGQMPQLSYYRDKEKNEVDLIFHRNGQLYPFEIKKTGTPKPEMLKNFKRIKAGAKKLGNGGIICLYDEMIRIDEDNYIIPVESILAP